MALCWFERIFAPVGQGAFYFERFFFQRQKDFNVVYDCGALYPSKSKRSLVNNLFGGRDVDILFISHFDYDHVSLIPDLINTTNAIKLVFLPFLYEEDKKIMVALYRVLEEELASDYGFVADLIENPRNIFGDDSVIIEIMPWEEENERREEEIDLDSILMSGQGISEQIRSGSRFLKRNCWLYVPYNFYHSRNAKKLKRMLRKVGIDVDRFVNNESYLKNLIEDRNCRRKIRKVYNKLEGNINSNSLVVYSGPLRGCRFRSFSEFLLRSFSEFLLFGRRKIYIYDGVDSWKRAGCLYTGDINLTDGRFILRSIFSKYWKEIGTIQVPHHGSKKSFSSKNFRKCVCAPISTGKNPFGHPSPKTLQELISLNTCPILVTEMIGFRQFGYAW